jgi:hypothetical protein
MKNIIISESQAERLVHKILNEVSDEKRKKIDLKGKPIDLLNHFKNKRFDLIQEKSN